MGKADLIAAAIKFTDWGEPWTFYAAVLGHVCHDSDDKAIFEHIWAEACRQEHWQRVDLAECCEACDHGLKEAFSWLPEEARAQFVRAASFQWK